MRTARSGRRGFSLLMVTMLCALLTISALVVIEIVASNSELLGEERRTREAREAAEGGTMEQINEEIFGDLMPEPSDADLTREFEPKSGAIFSSIREDGAKLDYEAKVSLLRLSPVLESSHSRVRAVVYELEVTGHAAGHNVVTQTQIYKMASATPGHLQGRRHAH